MSKILGIYDRLIFAVTMGYTAIIAGIYFSRDFIEEFALREICDTPWAAESFVNGALAFMVVLTIGMVVLGLTAKESPAIFTRLTKEP
jgi:hypothetical protein